MEYSDDFEDRRVIGVVTEEKPSPSQNPPPLIMSAPQRPMLLQMPMMQQGQVQFPLLFFLFPRVAMLLTTMRGQGVGQAGMRIQHITQIVRDKNGYISEVVEFVR